MILARRNLQNVHRQGSHFRPPLGPLLVLVLACLTACGGCVDTGPKQVKEDKLVRQKAAVNTQNHTAPQWQQTFIELATATSELKTAVALFSAGGWSDAGQVMVIATSSGATVHGVAPSDRRISLKHQLSAEEWQEFAATLAELSPLAGANDTAFDGIVYEFVELAKTNGDLTVSRRVLYQAGVNEGSEQRRLREAFGKLIKRN